MTKYYYDHANDARCKQLRREADCLYRKRNILRHEAKRARQIGDKLKAKRLCEQSKRIDQRAEKVNNNAIEYLFKKNNINLPSDEIDLHGLYVEEARKIIYKRLYDDLQFNKHHLKVIVGRGLHSKHGHSVLGPAIVKVCDNSNLMCHTLKSNPGIVYINLTQGPSDSFYDTFRSYYPQTSAQPSPQPSPQIPPQPENEEDGNSNSLISTMINDFYELFKLNCFG